MGLPRLFSPAGIGTSCVALSKVSNGCTSGKTLSKSIDPSRSSCDICLEVRSIPKDPLVNEDLVVFIGFDGTDVILSGLSNSFGELSKGIDISLPGLGPTGGGPAGLDGIGGGTSGLKGIGGGPAGRDGVGGGPSGRENTSGYGLEHLEGRGGKTGGLDGIEGAVESPKFLGGMGGGPDEPPTASS